MAKQPLVPVSGILIESRIHQIRGVRVMLDSDLAILYGATTSAINQAVDRNADRFPEDFSFKIKGVELDSLISQIVISKIGRGGRRKPTRVFTEHGVAMLSSVLRSETAVKVNVEIIRAFVRLRRLLATPGEILKVVQELAETVNFHGKELETIKRVLMKMIEPPPQPKPDRKMGFHPPA